MCMIAYFCKGLPIENEHVAKILKAFSPKSNLCSIISTKPSGFPEINGLRYVSSLFILAFHVQFFSFYKMTSTWNAFLLAEELLLSLITNGPIFVEIFFLIR